MKKVSAFLVMFGLAVGAALAWVTYDCIRERNYNSQPYEKKTDWPEMKLEFPDPAELQEQWAKADNQENIIDIALPYDYNTLVVTLKSGDVHVYYNTVILTEYDKEYIEILYYSVKYDKIMTGREYYTNMRRLDINPQDGRM